MPKLTTIAGGVTAPREYRPIYTPILPLVAGALAHVTVPGALLTATKPRNWRKYWGYRPNTNYRPAPDYIGIRKAYGAWLAKAHGLDRNEVEARIAGQSSATLLATSEVRESSACEVEDFGSGVVVRTVKVWSRGRQEHYSPQWLYDDKWTAAKWHKIPSGAGETLYRVIADGWMVDSYLTRARAKAKALALVAAREAVQRMAA